MRVLGIDPGSLVTGLAVVEVVRDGLRAVGHECIRMKPVELPIRLGEIHRGVQQMIAKHSPDMVSVERVFVSKNVHSALVLGQASGSAIGAAVAAGCDVVEYSTREIKLAVVGVGNAKKEQVQHMVRALLSLQAQPSTDEADALACAICHIHTMQVAQKLKQAEIG